MLDLGIAGAAILDVRLSGQLLGPPAPQLVGRHAPGDRVRPRPEMAPVLELGIRAQRAQECLLERVLGALAAQLPNEERPDLVPVALVEALERRSAHHRRYNAPALRGVRLAP